MLQFLRQDGKIIDLESFTKLGLQKEDCIKLYRLMLTARLFEEEVTPRAELGTPTLYISPRGQEAAQIASAYQLSKNDAIFWYKRSQAAALAKGVSLETLLNLFYEIPAPDLTDDFLNNGSLLPYSLVGAHLPHAVGYGLAKKMLKNNSVTAAYFGDGATCEGDFHSALNWASVFRVPVIFICENNRYAISASKETLTATETFAEKAKAYNMDWEVVDGNDVFAVYSATQKAIIRARNESKPTLIEMVTYRLRPHTSAIGHIMQVSKEEKLEAESKDPLLRMKLFLQSKEAKDIFGIEWDEEKENQFGNETRNNIKSLINQTLQLREAIDAELLISNLVSLHQTSMVDESYRQKVKEIDLDPEIIEEATGRDAINLAYYDVMRFDDRVVTLGEDVGKIGSVFRTVALPKKFVLQKLSHYQDRILQEFLPLSEIFGKDRVIDTPLDENGICGVSIGMALAGMRPVAEIQFSGFVFDAANQILAEMARLQQRGSGKIRLPIVIRLPYGGGKYIEHHREFEAPHFLNSPGLTAVCPSTVQDFYDLFWAAVSSDKPVLFFEDKNLYRSIIKGDLVRKPPEKSLEEFGARIAKQGNDATLVSYGRLVYGCLEAAEELQKEGISCEVIDLRLLSPIDRKTLIASVKKTGRLIVVQEEPPYYGIGSEIGALIYESDAFFSLQAKLKRVSPPLTQLPASYLWESYIPRSHQIIDAVRESMKS